MAAGKTQPHAELESRRRSGCYETQVQNWLLDQGDPSRRWKQPQRGGMMLGGGVSPRSSGKSREPQSGDTGFLTASSASALLVHQM